MLAPILVVALSIVQQAGAPGSQGDYVIRDFRFTTGEVLPELRLHYTTLGTPRKDTRGIVRNAIMVLHGTGGSGRGFLSRGFGGELFGSGQLLDTTRFYVVLPDNIGHGGSSKPSDGLKMKFPRYTYDDMVRAQHALLTDHLGVNHLRLIMGTSMGCMHGWVWGYTYPDFVDGLVPLACAPTQIAGRNRMMRRMIIDGIKEDPAWNGGNYAAPPREGLRTAVSILYLMGSAAVLQHSQAPTRDAADSVIQGYIAGRLRNTDANDMIYQFDSSRDYDPSPYLGKITAPVLAINSKDDLINPPELTFVDSLVAKVRGARFINLPITSETRGHGTHSAPRIWGLYLAEFLKGLPER